MKHWLAVMFSHISANWVSIKHSKLYIILSNTLHCDLSLITVLVSSYWCFYDVNISQYSVATLLWCGGLTSPILWICKTCCSKPGHTNAYTLIHMHSKSTYAAAAQSHHLLVLSLSSLHSAFLLLLPKHTYIIITIIITNCHPKKISWVTTVCSTRWKMTRTMLQCTRVVHN